MSVVHFPIHISYDIFDIKEVLFLADLGNKDNMKEKITQFFLEHFGILFFDSFDEFIDLFQ